MPKCVFISALLFCVLSGSSDAQSTTSIGPDGAILVNGEKIFPIGSYGLNFRRPFDERMRCLEIMAANGFNLVFFEDISTDDFGILLDSASRKNIHVLVAGSSLLDNNWIGETIDKYKNKPAVLGWALFDDSDDGQVTVEGLKERSDFVKAKDPNHFTYSTLTGYYTDRRAHKVAWIRSSDASAIQLYSITPPSDYSFDHGGNPLLESYSVARDYVAAAEEHGKAMLANTQTFNWDRSPGDRYPTVKELRNMFYGQIIAGVKGVLSYDFSFDFYENQKPLWNEWVTLKDDILKTLKDPILNGRFSRNTTTDKDLHYSYWEYDDDCYLVVANTSPISAKAIEITLPAAYAGSSTPLFSRLPHTLDFSNGQLKGSIGAADVQVYKIGKLPTALSFILNQTRFSQEPASVLLSWTAEDLDNTAGFELYHSTNEVRFEKIGFVKKTTGPAYTFTHERVASGKHHYKVKIVRQDGSQLFSEPKSINILANKDTIHIHPNPIQNNVANLTFTASSNEPAQIQVFDMAGRLMQSRTVPAVEGLNSEKIHAAMLPSGIYNVFVDMKSRRFSIKLIK